MSQFGVFEGGGIQADFTEGKALSLKREEMRVKQRDLRFQITGVFLSSDILNKEGVVVLQSAALFRSATTAAAAQQTDESYDKKVKKDDGSTLNKLDL